MFGSFISVTQTQKNASEAPQTVPAARAAKRVLRLERRPADLRAFWMCPISSCRTTRRAKEPAILIPGVLTRRTLLPPLVCTSLQQRLHVHCETLHLFPTSSSALWYESPLLQPSQYKSPLMSPTESNRCCSIPYTLVRSSDADHWTVLYLIKDNCHSTTRLRGISICTKNHYSDSIIKLIPDLSRQAQKKCLESVPVFQAGLCLSVSLSWNICARLPPLWSVFASQHLECMSLSLGLPIINLQ